LNDTETLEKTIQKSITDEAFRAMGFPYGSPVRKVFGPLMYPAAHRFARLAAEVDNDLEQHGIAETARKYLPDYMNGVIINGAEHIPLKGAAIIASNHPGTLDAPLIFSALPRDDLKVIVSGVPVVRALPGASKYLIYTPYDIQQRTAVVRGAIRHLNDGGLLMIFPTGKIDPDPAFLPGSSQALESWSKSLEIFLRRAPGTKVVPTIVSGVLDPAALRNPLTKLRREFWMQQRIAEYIQVAQMLMFHKKLELTPRVTFGKAINLDTSNQAGDSGELMELIFASAKEVLINHTNAY